MTRPATTRRPDARAEGQGRLREGNRRGLGRAVAHHRMRTAGRHARERRGRAGRPGARATRDRDGVGIALRARPHAGRVRIVDGAIAGEHLPRHAGGKRLLHRVARTERRLRARRAMQRRDRHCRRVSHRGRERRPDEDLRADAGVRVLLRRQRVRGRRQERRGGRLRLRREAGGTLDDDRSIVRSDHRPRPRGVRARGRRRRRQGRLERQRLNQLGLGQVQIARRQQAGLAGGIVDGIRRT